MSLSRPARWFVVAFGGAALAAAADIVMLRLSADCNDGVRDGPFLLLFVDPFILMFAVPIVAVSGLVSFFIGNYWLDDTDIWKTTILIYSLVLVEILWVGRSDSIHALYGAFPALAVGVVGSKLFFRNLG